MVITVIGLGFVGLTTALGLSSKGHIVYGIENNSERRNSISCGNLPYHEPHMYDALNKYLNKCFFVEERLEKAIPESDTVFFCVGTPFADDGSADLSFVYNAIDQTMPLLCEKKHTTLVIKSTVPMGTLQNKIIPRLIRQGYKPGSNFELVNNPEFLREGFCWKDFINADRIVIGDLGEDGFNNLLRVYQDFEAPKIHVTPNTAEFIKYLSNTLLATLISFSNEMADVAEAVGNVEISKAFSILHDDHRWISGSMSSYVYPGCGYGGYCLPKDTLAMLHLGQEYDQKMGILNEVIRVNSEMPERIANRIIDGMTNKSTIGILGLAFKPGTNDVRDSSAAKIINQLNLKGFKNIIAFDPVAKLEFQTTYPQLRLQFADSKEEVIINSDKTAIITAWPEFREYLDCPKVIDFRYMQ